MGEPVGPRPGPAGKRGLRGRPRHAGRARRPASEPRHAGGAFRRGGRHGRPRPRRGCFQARCRGALLDVLRGARRECREVPARDDDREHGREARGHPRRAREGGAGPRRRASSADGNDARGGSRPRTMGPFRQRGRQPRLPSPGWAPGADQPRPYLLRRRDSPRPPDRRGRGSAAPSSPPHALARGPGRGRRRSLLEAVAAGLDAAPRDRRPPRHRGRAGDRHDPGIAPARGRRPGPHRHRERGRRARQRHRARGPERSIRAASEAGDLESRMRVLAGTSGFSYDGWTGTFYPEDLPASGRLSFYATKLPAVEINNTFYRMPKPELLAGWAAQVPETFQFALKASQRITHIKRLKDTSEEVRFLIASARHLGGRLGPILFGLPPNLKKDVPRLEAFLALLPKDVKVAFEFRNPTWLDEEVFGLLRSTGAALCIADDEKGTTPLTATAGWGYLRLRREDYTGTDLDAWATRVGEQAWNEAYVFFKHEEDGAAPELARQFAERFAGRRDEGRPL